MELFESLKQKISGKGLQIVFPEGTDARVLGAANRLYADKLITPVFIGNISEVTGTLISRGINPDGFQIYDPLNCERFDKMVEIFVERRKDKVTEEQAREILKDSNYFGTMLVHMGIADGMVSGAVHSTADTVRPALQIIKTKPGVKSVSGAFIMVRGRDDNEKYIFADCAINIDPDANTLADIAVASAETAKLFDIDPKVAMLSFSTKGSGKSDDVTKVVEATALVKEEHPELDIDGELQFDAAFSPAVARQKSPDSSVAGRSNVFIFPDIQSGNIGYKIAQRLGNFEAIGPILQGLNAPISDLSRGSNEEDVYKLAIITAAQALK
ncbi:phosphate acetyltransferase [Lactococcus garvieae]|uniref:phosphate acetyltransferase n=1 Tax=Lactococcus garvieae TaxID=1363 RepID=UPI001A919CFF|nr:phosphate acetyltransferase [Lactococcus garvieae]MCO7130181.1 phosphate acetyltransferase [Lactococcus garvieae]QSQ97714.1 phosphate acetyltransferase [Lactococcus garvieae]